jgi:CubicO group peptidase (beta-lactamase class C family)
MIENGGVLDGVRILHPETIMLMTTNQVPREALPLNFFDTILYGTGYGLGFSVRMQNDPRWGDSAAVGEYGWGGLASTHDWNNPRDHLIVVTLEQFIPYRDETEVGIKRLIYDALRRGP